MPTLINQSLGRYHILEQLGEGGMATVYKAYDTRLETDVAVKVIRTENLAPSVLERSLKRFEREAKSLAKLTHPNIVKVTDYGEYEGKPYLVMPYLPGGTLKERIKQGPIPWQEAVRLILPIAQALEYAHEQNIIHRDVKPSNILLTSKGQPMLTDFGVAKLFDMDATADLTGTGMGVGTPEYMAPEQWQGQVSAQTDVYALGVVLFEMITGRRPYIADTPAALLLKQANDPLPRLKDFSLNLPENIEKMLLIALAKKREDRYQRISLFADAILREIPGTSSGNTTPFRLKPRSANSSAFSNNRTLTVDEQPTSSHKERTRRLAWTLGLVGIGMLAILIGSLNIDFPLFQSPRVSEKASVFAAASSTITTSVPTSTEWPTLTQSPTYKIGSTWIRPADGMVMVFVPKGEFIMGSDADDAMFECQKFRNDCSRDWFLDEEPQHQVFLDSFWIDQTEVTNFMYSQCVKVGVCSFPFRNYSYTRSDYYINEIYGNYPVMFVTWAQARTYCEWSGGHLPSEAQWEKAARGTDGRIYPWGDEFSENTANFCDINCPFPWAYKLINDNYNDTAPVKSYEGGKSIYGAYDMAGNVWEWTSSLRKPYPYDPKDGREDLFAFGDRVLRGGSWNFSIIGLRASHHDEYNDPELWINSIGFRCARSVP
jgi:serine/threonine-protein kinase